MKKLPLYNPGFDYLQRGFTEWLDILGYASDSVRAMGNILREFLHSLEQQQVSNIRALEQKHIRVYYEHINSRTNEKRGGGLSLRYIQMHMDAVRKFLEYLHHKGVPNVPSLGVRIPRPEQKEITVLTTEQIQQLFKQTEKMVQGNRPSLSPEMIEAIQSRDKVMLVMYYSCGLRKNEGVHLTVEDINLDTRILHIRKGKGYKERLVPFNKTNAKYLEEYIYDYRPRLLKQGKENRLFLSSTGKPMQGNSIYSRFKQLYRSMDDIDISGMEIGLHALRHSIATHLLQAGMSLEKIARFLGHSSMDTTQIYTHLAEKN